MNWKLVNFHICGVAITSSLVQKRGSPTYQGVAQGRDYHTLAFYWRLKVLALGTKRGRIRFGYRSYQSIRADASFLPQHEMDCSGSCFQRITNPLLLAIFRKTIYFQPNSKIRWKKIIVTKYKFGNDWQMESDGRVVWGNFIPGTLTGKDISKLFPNC